MSTTTRKYRKMPEPPAHFAGVASGIAYGMGAPTLLVRLVFVLLTVCSSGFGVLLYCMFVVTMDEWDEVPKDYKDVTSS